MNHCCFFGGAALLLLKHFIEGSSNLEDSASIPSVYVGINSKALMNVSFFNLISGSLSFSLYQNKIFAFNRREHMFASLLPNKHARLPMMPSPAREYQYGGSRWCTLAMNVPIATLMITLSLIVDFLAGYTGVYGPKLPLWSTGGFEGATKWGL